MTWNAIIKLLLDLVGPYLSDLLREVRAGLWWWQWGRKRLLDELIRTTPDAVAAGVRQLHPEDAAVIRALAAAA